MISPPEEARYEAVIRAVLDAVETYLPTEVTGDETSGATLLALAAIRRMADLIDAELRLALQNRHSITRVLGRSVIELWLNANELLLDAERALTRLQDEDAKQQAGLQAGYRTLWERLESKRDDGIQLHDPGFVAEDGRIRPDVEKLAFRVHTLREARGFGGGISEVRYELCYRYDSAHDVHVGLDLLFRYIGQDQGNGVRVLKEPAADQDIHGFRGWDAVIEDTRLLSDILGIYLHVIGRHNELDALRARLRDS